MIFYSLTIKKILRKWPGRKTFGIYRFLPLFFLCGATIEFSMINWQVGEVNFYKTYKKRKIQELVEERLNPKEDLFKKKLEELKLTKTS